MALKYHSKTGKNPKSPNLLPLLDPFFLSPSDDDAMLEILNRTLLSTRLRTCGALASRHPENIGNPEEPRHHGAPEESHRIFGIGFHRIS